MLISFLYVRLNTIYGALLNKQSINNRMRLPIIIHQGFPWTSSERSPADSVKTRAVDQMRQSVPTFPYVWQELCA